MRKAIHKGDYVKGTWDDGRNRESMWAKVRKIEGSTIHATLASHPVLLPMRFGQRVRIPMSEVISVYRGPGTRGDVPLTIRPRGKKGPVRHVVQRIR